MLDTYSTVIRSATLLPVFSELPMRPFQIAPALLLLACKSAPERVTGSGETGAGSATMPGNPALAALEHFEDLPLLKLGMHALSFSSADPRVQNDDHSKYLYSVGEEQVLFDAEGPGVINRWWHTGELEGEYRLYFDGETTPRLVLKKWDFWKMQVAPFLEPILLDDYKSSGGFVTYYPIGFARSLRITSVGARTPDYYNFGYSRYSDRPVLSFTGKESLKRVVSLFSHAGEPPIEPGPSDVVTAGSVQPGAGGPAVLASLPGPGQIVGLVLTVAGSAPGKAVPLAGVRLQIFWDGQSAPAVDVPVPEFFGMTTTQNVLVRGLPVGHIGDRFYCYFPMPYASAAKVQLLDGGGGGTTSVGYRIVSRPFRAPFEQAGYFHAVRNAAVTTKDRDFVMLAAQGSGHYVGLNMMFPSSGSTLEGNERIYVDGARTPAINGTGTEDYFNGGFYFSKGPFTAPTHGAPSFDGKGPFNAYRFHIADVIPFASSITVGMQHDQWNQNAVPYASVAYYYLNPKVRSTQSDRLDLADPGSIAQHRYAAAGTEDAPVTSRFPSDDPTTYTHRGRTLSGPSTFTLQIDPRNQGVTLRRLLDQSVGRQAARISIDDVAAGTWKTPSLNQTFRWREDDFWVPPALTRGKDRVVVKVAPETRWNEFSYEAYSLLPP